jgi:hypothetical protein
VDVVLASKRGCGLVLKNNQLEPTHAEPYSGADRDANFVW